MRFFNFFFLIFIIYYSSLSVAQSKDKLAYINLDNVIENSIYGKKVLSEIKLLNDENIKKLKNMENEVKSDENELNKKKNILSEKEFNNEFEKFKEKLSEYRKIKNEITKDFKSQKNEKLNNFFLKINPIIQEYMDEKSIDILFRQENIFIGKTSADITSIIIEKINNSVN